MGRVVSGATPSPIEAHTWGESRAADHIWAEVCGRAPSTKPWRRWLMVIQAYIDDSYTDGGVHVLAGYMARAEAWAEFSKDWEVLLPLARMGNNGKHRFKMSEMAHRMEFVPAFYNVIQKHAAFAVNFMISEADLERARARIWSDNVQIVWGPQDEIQNILFLRFIPAFFEWCWEDERIRNWLGGDQIDIYFDNDIAPGWVCDEWEKLIREIPEHAQSFIGDRPKPADDEEFLPLQAADFWAWWSRKGYEDGKMKEIGRGDFGSWKAQKVPGFQLSTDEDRLTALLILLHKRSHVIQGIYNIYDSNKTPKSEYAIMPIEKPKQGHYLNYFKEFVRTIRRPRS